MLAPNFIFIFILTEILLLVILDIIFSHKLILTNKKNLDVKSLLRVLAYILITIIPLVSQYFSSIINDEKTCIILYWVSFTFLSIVFSYWLYFIISIIRRKKSFITSLVLKDKFNVEEISIIISCIFILVMFSSYSIINRQYFSVTVIPDVDPSLFFSDSTSNNYTFAYKISFNNLSENQYGIEVFSTLSQFDESLISNQDTSSVPVSIIPDLSHQTYSKIIGPKSQGELTIFKKELNFKNFSIADTSTILDRTMRRGRDILPANKLDFPYDSIKTLYYLRQSKHIYGGVALDALTRKNYLNSFCRVYINIINLNDKKSYQFQLKVFLKHFPLFIPDGAPGTIPTIINCYSGWLVECAFLTPIIITNDINIIHPERLFEWFTFHPYTNLQNDGNIIIHAVQMDSLDFNHNKGIGFVIDGTKSLFGGSGVFRINFTGLKDFIQKKKDILMQCHNLEELRSMLVLKSETELRSILKKYGVTQSKENSKTQLITIILSICENRLSTL